MRLASVLVGVLIAPLLAHAATGQTNSTDRVVALVAEARRSPCFLAPTRPPLYQPVAAEVVVSATQGDGAAMHRIAEAYLADPARPRQALDWLERAAMAGAVSAAADAGSLHAAGRGTIQDEEVAVLWWRYGATRGDARAMGCLSVAYVLGLGVDQDLTQATRWALLREARAPGRLLMRPKAQDFERAVPSTILANARREARSAAQPTPPPPNIVRWEEPQLVLLPQRAQTPGVTSSITLPPRLTGATTQLAGSGVVVGQAGMILTSAHVVNNCLALEIHAGLAKLGGVEMHALHLDYDLALLSVPGLQRTPLPVRSDVRLGEEVVLLGYPGAGIGRQDATVTVGNVSAFGSQARDWQVQFTAPLTAGNSGGPLLDRRGQIVGIAIRTANLIGQLAVRGDAPQNVNIAVSATIVARFLDDHGIALGTAGAMRPVPDLVADAGRSVVQVVCHRRPERSAPVARAPRRSSPTLASD